MTTVFTVDTPAKQAALKAGLEKLIQDDCEGGRKHLAEKIAEGLANKMSKPVLATIEKNIGIREAVYKELIAHLERRGTDKPLSLDEFFSQFVLSFSQATMREDDYSSLFFDMVKTTQIPEDIRRQVQAVAEKEGAGSVARFVKIPAHKLKPEELQLIPVRAKTIETVTHKTFDLFYEAATGKNPYVGKVASPEYTEFTDQANHLLYGDELGKQR
jgi:hypothetical protein